MSTASTVTVTSVPLRGSVQLTSRTSGGRASKTVTVIHVELTTFPERSVKTNWYSRGPHLSSG